jgi:DNA-directed RNA polymerase specialized sigma24 family protein
MVAEEYLRLLDLLPDEKYRAIAVWKMEGHTREEIAAKLGCATKTVANKLDYIRKAWKGTAP